MDNRRVDDELTAQDYERREWQPRDVLLMVLAVLVPFTLLFVFVLIFFFVKPEWIFGF